MLDFVTKTEVLVAARVGGAVVLDIGGELWPVKNPPFQYKNRDGDWVLVDFTLSACNPANYRRCVKSKEKHAKEPTQCEDSGDWEWAEEKAKAGQSIYGDCCLPASGGFPTSYYRWDAKSESFPVFDLNGRLMYRIGAGLRTLRGHSERWFIYKDRELPDTYCGMKVVKVYYPEGEESPKFSPPGFGGTDYCISLINNRPDHFGGVLFEPPGEGDWVLYSERVVNHRFYFMYSIEALYATCNEEGKWLLCFVNAKGAKFCKLAAIVWKE